MFQQPNGSRFAFVKCKNREYQHIGGTGVGGGTLFNLSKKISNVDSFEDIINASLKGNLRNVDLTIQDVTNKEIKTLPKQTQIPPQVIEKQSSQLETKKTIKVINKQDIEIDKPIDAI